MDAEGQSQYGFETRREALDRLSARVTLKTAWLCRELEAMAPHIDESDNVGPDLLVPAWLEIARSLAQEIAPAEAGYGIPEDTEATTAASRSPEENGAEAAEEDDNGCCDIELSEARARFEAETTALGILAGGRLTHANTAFALALGYPSPADVISAGLEAIFPDTTSHAFNPSEAKTRAVPGSVILSGVTRSGRRLSLPVGIYDIGDKARAPAHLLVVLADPQSRQCGSGEIRHSRKEPGDQRGRHSTLKASETGPDGPAPGRETPSAPAEANETLSPVHGDGSVPPATTSDRTTGHTVHPTPELEFLAKVSHELRTPLNSIIGFAELMKAERWGALGSDRYRTYVKDIEESGRFALDLVNDLLDISKVRAGAFELNFASVDLNEVVSECIGRVQPQAQKARVLLRVSLAPDLPLVLADRRSVTQILDNLIFDSLSAAPAGGQLIICSLRKSSGAAQLRVADNRIGMSVAEIEQALQPFKQTDTSPRTKHGTGLSLPLTKALVEANQATFEMTSRPGRGTEIAITFPGERTL